MAAVLVAVAVVAAADAGKPPRSRDEKTPRHGSAAGFFFARVAEPQRDSTPRSLLPSHNWDVAHMLPVELLLHPLHAESEPIDLTRNSIGNVVGRTI